MILPDFELRRPETVDEALTLLAEGDSRPLAGGTDLLPSMKQGLFRPGRLVSLRAIPELHGVREAPGGGWRIGAATTLAQLIRHPGIGEALPALVEAAALVGTPLIQTSATLGGNLLLDTRCLYYNQSAHWRASLGGCLKEGGAVCHVAPGGGGCVAAFSADTVPPLLAYGARVEIASAAGRRDIPLDALYRPGDGMAWLTLARGDLLVAAHIPPPAPGLRVAYLKHRLRGAIDFPLVGVAAAVHRDGEALTSAELWLTAVDTAPVKVDVTSALKDAPTLAEGMQAAGALAAAAVTPLGTHGVSAGYRKRMAAVFARRALSRAF